MRILLTGCHGFIGRNVNDELMEREDVDSVICIEKDYMNIMQECFLILRCFAK